MKRDHLKEKFLGYNRKNFNAPSIKPRVEPPEWMPPDHFTILFCDSSWGNNEQVQARLRFKRSSLRFIWNLESCEFLTDSKGIEFTTEWPISEFRRLAKAGYLLRTTVEKFKDTTEHIIPII